ncbi:MAG: carboxypeptidase-like regulatory domain-containing protein [Pricia sp.]
MRRSRLISLVLYFLSLLPFSVFSQQPEFLRGRLFDSQTGEPVAFATIRIKDRAMGVISNQDGSFQFPEKFKDYGEMLEISSMGYGTKDVKISGLSPFDINVIRLNPGIFELEEAVVAAKGKRLSAKRIVQTAIDRIPINYPNYPYSLVGYYRDYQLENRNYVNLNEGILEVFDAGFSEDDLQTSKVQMYDYTNNTDFERDSLAERPYDYKNHNKTIDNAYLSSYGGNEFTILRIHDAIRNYKIGSYDFIHRFQKDFIKEHVLKKDGESAINGESMYVISATKKIDNHRVIGKLYISKSNFAIHKLEYTIYLLPKPGEKSSRLASNNSEKLILDTVVEYRPNGPNMFLNFISFSNTFRLSMPPKYKVNEVVAELGNNRFTVKMNKIGLQEDLVDLKNYKIEFMGKKVKIDYLQFYKNDVFVYPKIQEGDSLFIKIAEASSEDSKLLEDFMKFDFGKIRDREGNVLNQPWFKPYNQFREFFVQQVNKGKEVVADSLLMRKTRPLYYELQPMSKPDNFDEYWMNTPLQSAKSQATVK